MRRKKIAFIAFAIIVAVCMCSYILLYVPGDISYASRMFQEISRMIRVELARRRMLRQIKEEHYETTNIRQDGDASTLLL